MPGGGGGLMYSELGVGWCSYDASTQAGFRIRTDLVQIQIQHFYYVQIQIRIQVSNVNLIVSSHNNFFNELFPEFLSLSLIPVIVRIC
jgi:hypothetical protein